MTNVDVSITADIRKAVEDLKKLRSEMAQVEAQAEAARQRARSAVTGGTGASGIRDPAYQTSKKEVAKLEAKVAELENRAAKAAQRLEGTPIDPDRVGRALDRTKERLGSAAERRRRAQEGFAYDRQAEKARRRQQLVEDAAHQRQMAQQRIRNAEATARAQARIEEQAALNAQKERQRQRDAANTAVARDVPIVARDTRERAFKDLGNRQRRAPESAMERYQRSFGTGGGLYGFALEHVGDLTHRATQIDNQYGYQQVKEKVEAQLRALRSGYGFDREVREQLQSGYQFEKERGTFAGSFENYEARHKRLGAKYADEHAKLPVYNELQRASRDAAVALGRGDTAAAVKNLEVVERFLGNQAAYVQAASKFDPHFDDASTRRLVEQDAKRAENRANAEKAEKARTEAASRRRRTELLGSEGGAKLSTLQQFAAGKGGAPENLKAIRQIADAQALTTQRVQTLTNRQVRDAINLGDARRLGGTGNLIQYGEEFYKQTAKGQAVRIDSDLGQQQAAEQFRQRDLAEAEKQAYAEKRRLAQQFRKDEDAAHKEQSRRLGRDKAEIDAHAEHKKRKQAEVDKAETQAYREKARIERKQRDEVLAHAENEKIKKSQQIKEINKAETEAYAEQKRRVQQVHKAEDAAYKERDRRNRVDASAAKARAKGQQGALANLLAKQGNVEQLSSRLLYDPTRGNYYKTGPSGGLTKIVDPAALNVAQNIRYDRVAQGKGIPLYGRGGQTPPPPAPPTRTPPPPGASDGGFFGGGGFGGIGKTIANYGRYVIGSSIVLGALGAAGRAMDEITDYRDSLTDLNQALRGTGEAQAGFIDQLQDVSRLAGENVGAAIDAAARGIRAFGAELDSLQEKQAAGLQVATSAQQLSVVAGKPLTDATGDLIAVGSAYGLGSGSLSRVVDSIAVAKQQIGADPAQIAQGLANGAIALQEAGFSLEESAQVIALVQARTDQSGQATATRLSRIVSKFGSTGAINAIRSVNRALPQGQQIDTDASIRDQLLQLGAIYDKLNESQQRSLASSIAGASNLRELIPLLNESGTLVRAMDASYDGAGAGLEEFNRKNNDLAGTLRKISGDTSNLIVNLSDAAFSKTLGLGLKVLEQTLNVVNQLLQAYNRLPGVIKEGVTALLTYRAISRLMARDGVQGFFARGRLRGEDVRDRFGRGVGRASRRYDAIRGFGGPVFTSPIARHTAYSRRGFPTQGPIDFRQTGRNISQGFNALPGAKLLKGVGGFLALDVALSSLSQFGQLKTSIKNASDTIAGLDFGNSAKDMRDAVVSMKSAAENIRSTTSGMSGFIVNLATFGESRRKSESIDDYAKFLQEKANERAALERAAATDGDFSDLINVATPDGITSGLDQIAGAGGTASQQLAAVRKAWDEAQVEAERFGKTFASGPLAAQPIAKALEAQGAELTEIESLDLAGAISKDAASRILGLQERLKLAPPTQSIRLGYGQPLQSDGIRGFDQYGFGEDAIEAIQPLLTQSDFSLVRDALIEAALDNTEFQGDEAAVRAKVETEVDAAVENGLRDQFEKISALAVLQLVQSTVALIESVASAEGVSAALAGGFQSTAVVDSKLSGIREDIARARRDGTDDKTIAVLLEKEQEYLLAKQQDILARIDGDAKLEQSLLSEADVLGMADAQIASVRAKLNVATEAAQRQALQAELNGLLRDREKLVLAQIKSSELLAVDPRDTAGVRYVEAHDVHRRLQRFIAAGAGDSTEANELRLQLTKFEIAAVEEANQILALQDQRAVGGRDAVGAAAAKLKDIRRQLEAGAFGPQLEQLLNEEQAVTEQLQDLTVRRRAALRTQAIGPGDAIRADQAAINGLYDQLKLLKPGTTEAIEKQNEIDEAEFALAQRRVEAAKNARLAQGPVGSATLEAAAELEAAAANLALFEQGSDEYNQAVIRWKQAMAGSQQAVMELSNLQARLLLDLTDPVVAAEQALKEALDAAATDGDLSPEQQAINDQAAKSAQQAVFSAKQSEFLRQLNYEKQIGDLTQTEYVNALQQRLEVLKAMDDGSHQMLLAIQEIELAIHSAEQSLSGMFNLGDIDVPTPYEVRRALNSGLNSAVLGGDGAYQPTGVAVAPQTNVTNYIQIDGADFDKVVGYLEGALGQQATSRTAGGVYSTSAASAGRKF